jgi:N-acetylneuraminate synthase
MQISGNMLRGSPNTHPLGESGQTYVIAEAGSNHNGDIETAKQLIEVAADAGADAVKFQVFRAEHVYVEDSGTTDYLGDERPIYDIISELEMPYDWIPTLYEHCKQCDIDFMASATDEKSIEAISEYVPAFKIPSYTMTHYELLEYVAQQELPVIMSTGAHTFAEITDAVEYIQSAGVNPVVLHCVAAYPTPIESIHVRVVERIREELGVLSGLSDHTVDPVTAPCAAVTLGAAVVEKHFTLDRSMEGPDHDTSLEPDELGQMITAIRKTETALGSADRPVYDVESELHDIARRRIHATDDIAEGEPLTRKNTAVLRSGKRRNGLHPKQYPEVLGQQACRDIDSGEGITWEHLESE